MASRSKINRLSAEIVDDSEPEREELRRMRTGKRRPGGERHPNTRERGRLSDTESSESLSCTLGQANYNPRLVIDISDDASDFGAPPSYVSIDPSAFPGSSKTTTESSAQGISLRIDNDNVSELVVIPNHITLTSGPSDFEEFQSDMDIARFAYKNAQPSSSRFVLPQSTTTNSIIPPKQALLLGAARRQNTSFTGVELAKLMRCVSCDVRWTTRKTTSQKLHHVRLCAKRNGYDQETVDILIRKEIDSTIAQSEKDSRSLPQHLGPPKTLFEDYVAHPAFKKKGTRREKEPTIRNVVDTRPSLLDRAQAVLGCDVSTALHDFTRDRISADTVPGNQNFSTQQFGRSNLALMHGSTSSLFSVNLHAEKMDMNVEPPATQAFAPSKFSSTSVPYIQHERSPLPPNYIAQDSLFTSPNPTPSPLLGNMLDFLNSSVRLPSSPSARGSGRLKTGVEHSSQGIITDNSVCQYRISRDTFDTTTDLDSCIPETLSPTEKQRRGPKQIEFNPSNLGVTPRKIKLKPLADAFDKKWEQSLKSKICRDGDLYLRILRYEPVHFDTFLKIALEDNVMSIKLKESLINFLDKGAINFHKGEERKQRRPRLRT